MSIMQPVGDSINGRPLRVLHISSVYPPHVVGGAEKVVAQLAQAQALDGMEVGAAFLTRELEPDTEYQGVHTFPQVDRNLIWMEDVAQQSRWKRTANKLLQVINVRSASDFGAAIARFKPDIVHTHSMVELPPQIWGHVRRSGAKLVHTLHDYDLICSRASMFRDGRNCVERHASCRILGSWKARFARHIDAVVAVSQPVLDEHRRHGLFEHLPEERMRVIWNAMPARETTLPARLQRGAEIPFTFGFLGRLVPEKGVETLLEACRFLPERGWRLQIAGKARGDIAGWHAMAKGLPIDFLGFVDPAPFLDGLDVLVVPSIWREPFGLTVVEAFARGVPVIGARQGAIADLVGAVGDEWLTPPGDATALADRMLRVMSDGRQALPPAAAFVNVLEAVAPERMTDDYALLYAYLHSEACPA